MSSIYAEKVRSWSQTEGWMRELEALLDFGMKGKKADVVVDVGCGWGRAAQAFKRRGSTAYCGFDVLPDYPYGDMDFGETRRYLGHRLPLPAMCCDAVLLFHVLPHCDDHLVTLAEAHRVLSPGGVILVSVHNQWYDTVMTPVHWAQGYKDDPTIKKEFTGLKLDEAFMDLFGELPDRRAWGDRALRIGPRARVHAAFRK